MSQTSSQRPSRFMGFVRGCLLALFVTPVLVPGAASAATYTWTNGSGNRTWDTSLLNWTLGSGNVAWVAANDAVFGSTSPGTITVSGSQSVTSLAFTGTGFTLTGGTIGLASATTSFTASQSGTIGSVLAGANGLLSNGTATLVLTGSNTYSGSTLIAAGTLQFAGTAGRLAGTSAVTVTGAALLNGDATATTNNNISNRINSGASLTLGGTAGGGTYTQIAPAANNTHSQSFTGLALGSGVNVISPNGTTGTNSLIFTGAAASAYTRSPGGTLNIIPQTGSIIAFSNLPSITAGSGADAILPGATINGNDFVGLAGSGPYTTGTAAYVDTNTTTWTAGKNMNVTGSMTPGVATNVNSIRFGSATNYTVTLTGSNVIGSGNVLVSSAASTASSTITGGTITSAAMSGTVAELTIFDRRGGDYRSANPLVVGSVIADNGGTPLAVTIAGKSDGTAGQFNTATGLVSLTGANTFSGVLSLVSGGVSVNGDSNLGTAPSLPATNIRSTGISALRVNNTATLSANRIIELNNSFLTIYPTISSSGTLTIAGQIIGTGTIQNYTNRTQGILVLSGSNTFSGALLIGTNPVRADDGTGLSPNANLQFIHNSTSGGGVLQTSGTFTRAIGAGPGQVSWLPNLGAGGNGGFATNSAPLTVALGGVGSLNTFQWGTAGVTDGAGIILQGDSGLTWLNPINLTTGSTATRTIATNSGTAELRGLISGNSTANLSFLGSGVVLPTGANSYAGKTSILAGTAGVTSINSVVGGSPTSSLGAPTTEANGTIDMGSPNNIASLRYLGTGEATDRKLNIPTNQPGYGATVDQSGSGLLKFTTAMSPTGYGSGKVFTLQGSTAGQGEFAGAITDNPVTGTTTLNAAFASGTSTITLDSVTGVVVGAAVSGTGIAAGTTVTAINAGTRVITLSANTNGAGTAGSLISVAGVMNTVTVTKAGTGIWTLSGSNGYSAGTTISAGILTFMTPVAQPSSGTVTVSGGSLGLGVGGASSFTSANVDAAFNNALTRVSMGSGAGVALDTTAGNFTYASNLIAASNPNTRGLTKIGANTLTLSGSNSTLGTVTAVAGTLQFANTAALYGGVTTNWTASKLVTGSGATLAFNVGGSNEFTQANVTTLLTNLAASSSTTNGMSAGSNLGFDTSNASGGTFTINDTIADTTGASGGARGLVKLGAGTLVLGGSNAFSGATTINAGTISFANKNALGATSGIRIGDGARLLYTGATDALGRNISVSSGTGTVTNAGSGTLTLTGTLAKNGTVLRLSQGSFNVTGSIVGSSPKSDLVVAGTSTVMLSSANTYNGPTFVIESSTLALNTNNAIPNASVVTLGDGTTRGTLDVGTFTDAVGGLSFDAGGGTLRIATTSTAAAPFTAATGTMTLTNGTLDLAGSGSTAGLYRVLSAQAISGSFASITNASAAYQVISSATSVDYQQRAVLSTVNVTNPVISIITGGSAAFTYTVANSALSGGASLSFTGAGLLNVAGSSSGSAAAAGTSNSISGLVFTGTGVGNNQQGTFTVSAPTAYGATTATGTVSVNVLDHATASLASSLLTSTTTSLGTWNYASQTWESGGNSALFSIFNLASTAGAASTADLALLGVTGTGNGFTTNLASYADIAGGTSSQFAIFFDPAGLSSSSTLSAQFQIAMGDKRGLSGATNSNTLFVTANVIVVPEPGTLALLGIGIAVAARATRRRA